ncbi:hypothetical protein NQZ68_018777 [Dissostichus eleginoides]|nr:hypothetical protein NQZ68_018777 [Dissostichus eleginoides]
MTCSVFRPSPRWKAVSRPYREEGESGIMMHGCQSICPKTAFLSQGGLTLSCTESVKRERLKGALWHFGNNLLFLLLPDQALASSAS